MTQRTTPAEDTVSEAELPVDLTPEQLVQFLSMRDKNMETAFQQMQLIASGQSQFRDVDEARETMLRIVRMKREGSRRLASHPDATFEQQIEGRRGEMQSLSHLASLSDVKAAEELERLAKSNLESGNARLVSDSRLVLIGFAIESLQNGNESGVDQIVEHVDAIAKSNTADVAAMMVMGQARQVLSNYGHSEPAQQVRQTIFDLFADSPNPEIARMAAQQAGKVEFDDVEELLNMIVRGNEIETNKWTDAVRRLIDDAPDLQTVRYLAGAGLNFESLGRQELVDATFAELQNRFASGQSAMSEEIELAVKARSARQDVIGQVIEPDLKSADGAPLKLADFRGKVVLMPFWAVERPESQMLIPKLQAIQSEHADQVAIVGMSLDAEDVPVDQFLEKTGWGFPNFQVGDQTQSIAMQFGIMSMPFVAVLDQKGRVAAIALSDFSLETAVERLLEP